MNLTYHLISISNTSVDNKKDLYQIMLAHYDHTNWETFQKDLESKQYIGLIKKEQVIVGFTTFSINPGFDGLEDFNIIFSGDTIISKEYWGSQILAKGWLASIEFIMKSDTHKLWYWFLISKGHRTYLYLPFFFKQYYPAAEKENEADLLEKVDYCSNKIFKPYWDKNTGLIKFKDKLGQLKADISVPKNIKSKHVNFFLQKNPKYYEGDELVCMAELNINNFSALCMRYYGKVHNEINLPL